MKEKWNDKEYVLKAVKKDGWNLEFVSDELKNDREVIFTALEKCPDAFECLPNNLRDDEEIVMYAIKKDGTILSIAGKNSRNNKDIVLEAVKNSYIAFRSASPNLKDDKEFVLKTVKINPLIIQYVSDGLQKDKDIITIIDSIKEKELEFNKIIEETNERIKNKKIEDICFKDSRFDKICNLTDGWNAYGLTVKGDKDTIHEIKNKYLSHIKKPKRLVLDDGKNILFEKEENNTLQISIKGHVPIEVLYLVLKEYPNIKLATFWEGNVVFHSIYVLYSEIGTSDITKNEFVAEISSEGINNPLFEIDIIDTKKKFNYIINDSNTGFSENKKVDYSFPFLSEWQNDCQMCLDN